MSAASLSPARRNSFATAAEAAAAAPGGVPSEAANLKSWQFAFSLLDHLPEILVQGHERAAALEKYVRVFSAPGTAGATSLWYRAGFSPEGLLARDAVSLAVSRPADRTMGSSRNHQTSEEAP